MSAAEEAEQYFIDEFFSERLLNFLAIFCSNRISFSSLKIPYIMKDAAIISKTDEIINPVIVNSPCRTFVLYLYYIIFFTSVKPFLKKSIFKWLFLPPE